MSIVYSIVLQFYLERYENFFKGLASLFPCFISFSRTIKSLLEELFSLKLLLLSSFDIELLDKEDWRSKSIIFLGLRISMSYSIDLAFTLLKYDFLLFLFASLWPCFCSLSRWIDSELLLELLLSIESFLLLSNSYESFNYFSVFACYVSTLLLCSMLFIFHNLNTNFYF